MSFEYSVYLEGPKVTRRALREDLREQGWEVRLCEQGFGPAPEDAPLGDDLLIGWPASSPHAAEAEALLRAGDEKALDDLYRKGVVASCQITSSEIDPGEWQERREDLVGALGAANADLLMRCTHMLVSRTPAGRSNSSVELQMLAWKSMARIGNGWAEDEMEGTWAPPVHGGVAQPLPSAPAQRIPLARWALGLAILAFLFWWTRR